MRTLFLAAALAAAALSAPAPAHADERPVYTAPLSNLGAGGYDVVAYFTDNRPVRGAPQFRVTHNGVEYRFSSAEHQAAFERNPTRYLPQYGGYCAWAVSQGYTASANPRNWRIVDGRLYLNYNTEVQRRWEQDINGHIRSADANWPRVLGR